MHGTPPRSLEIDVGERLTAGVADDEAGLRLDRPRRREGDRLDSLYGLREQRRPLVKTRQGLG
jgi:hypothetical protein